VRRLLALALFVAAVPTAASLVPWLRPDSGCCAMVCHPDGSHSGGNCCLGASPGRPVLQSCAGAVDGVPPAPGCALSAPRLSTGFAAPALAGRFEPALSAVPSGRSLEVPDPVPLALS